MWLFLTKCWKFTVIWSVTAYFYITKKYIGLYQKYVEYLFFQGVTVSYILNYGTSSSVLFRQEWRSLSTLLQMSSYFTESILNRLKILLYIFIIVKVVECNSSIICKNICVVLSAINICSINFENLCISVLSLSSLKGFYICYNKGICCIIHTYLFHSHL